MKLLGQPLKKTALGTAEVCGESTYAEKKVMISNLRSK